MRIHRWIWFAGFCFLFFVVNRHSQGQQVNGPPADRPQRREGVPANGLPPISFSIEDSADVRDVVNRREIAIADATRVLERVYCAPKSGDDGIAERAIKLLGDLRADEGRVVELLVKNIQFAPPVTSDDEEPISGLVAAQSLIRIGGKSVMSECIESLDREMTRKHLLIVAHVILGVESNQAAHFRVRTSLAAERTSVNPNSVLIANLEQLQLWLASPHDLMRPENWPSTQ